jgi:hypothetical protein
MRIYVGNLKYGVTDEQLKDMFGEFGEVASADVIKDKFSGQSKGFGFVDMPNDAEAGDAIAGAARLDARRPQADRERGPATLRAAGETLLTRLARGLCAGPAAPAGAGVMARARCRARARARPPGP